MKHLAAAMLTLMIISQAEAASWRWPWEPRAVHRSHPRYEAAPAPAAPPNCDRINESVKVLTPKNLDRALRESTPKQRETIDNCARDARP